MRCFGLEEDYVLIGPEGESLIGMPRSRLLERVRHSAFLLNIMGYLRDEEILGLAARRIFLDIDPGFGQFWNELGLHRPFAGHDAYVTIGLNIGRPDCTIPTCGLDWIVTPQPVVLEWWPRSDVPGESFTTIASWRGAYGPVEFQGRYLRSPRAPVPPIRGPARAHRPPVRAGPRHSPSRNERPGTPVRQRDGHWSIPRWSPATRSPIERYIGRSRAEFSVAKDMYVQSRGGWISDRSLCYLASGKPVLAQETGFSRHYPTGEGLLTYSTLEEAVAGVEEITRRPDRHARAARALAEEYFDSDKVLGRLLQKLGVA